MRNVYFQMEQQLMGVKIIIVGCGYWGRNFVRILKHFPDVSLAAIVDSSLEDIGIETIDPAVHLFTNIEHAIANTEFDAAIVATPVHTHCSIVKQLLEAKKHVLCEKILSVSLEEIILLETLSKQNDSVLMVGHTYLFNTVVKNIKQRIDEQRLGKILHATFKRTGLGPIRRDVSVIEDLASHDLSIALYWFGIPDKIFCTARDIASNGLSDIAYLQLLYKNGLIINIEVSWLNPIKQRLIEVTGDKQMIIFDDINSTEKLKIIDPGSGYFKEAKDFALHQVHIRGGDIVAPNISYGEPLKDEVSEFLNVIATRKPSIDTIETAKKIASLISNIRYNA